MVNEFYRGGITQLRVIYAIILRETRTRFGSHQLGYLWALLEPSLWIATFAGAFQLAGRVMPDSMGVVPFLATGIIPYEVVMRTTDRGSLSISANKALLFYPQVQPLDLVIARSILEVVTFTAVLIVTLGAHALFTQHWNPDSLLRVMMGLGLGGLLGWSAGLLLCSLGVLSNAIDRMKGPLFRPLFWISGLFFSLNHLPSNIQKIFLYNPILHCVEIVRDGWFPQYHSAAADPGYVLIWIVVLSFLGLTLERFVRVKVQLT